MSEPKKVDWERIEVDYRAGIKSTREIAAEHAISHTAINKRSKAYSWTRDLSAKIQAKAEAMVSRAAVSAEVSASRLATEKEVIDANAQAIVDIRLEHRRDIRRAKDLVMSLFSEVESQTTEIELYERLGELMSAPDDRGIDRLNDLYRKVISTSGRVTNVKALSDALKSLVSMDREAWNLGQPEAKQSDVEQLTEADLDARINEHLGRLK